MEFFLKKLDLDDCFNNKISCRSEPNIECLRNKFLADNSKENLSVNEVLEKDLQLGCCLKFFKAEIIVQNGETLDNHAQAFMHGLTEILKKSRENNHNKDISSDDIKRNIFCRRDFKNVSSRFYCLYFYHYTECTSSF